MLLYQMLTHLVKGRLVILNHEIAKCHSEIIGRFEFVLRVTSQRSRYVTCAGSPMGGLFSL